VVAARRSGARELLTEDLQEGRRFDRLLVVNPFARPRD
jgi:predicted nucleic acid-binding protein